MSDSEALRQLTGDVAKALSTIEQVDKNVREQSRRIETHRLENREAHNTIHKRLDKIEKTVTEHRTAVRIFRWMLAGLGGILALLGAQINFGKD